MKSLLDQVPTRRRRTAPRSKPASTGFSLGRILGIEVTLDTSWLLIFALISFSLYTSLASDYPGRPQAYYWIGALCASVAFFASILLHELSHSLVARLRGMEVHGITLFFFGGISRLKDEPKKPIDEFLMAVVGPLSSAVLGVLFIGAKWLLPSGTLGAGLVGWLGFINLALAGFNLLPGFPLDGGRVFRAIAWGVTGNLTKATRIAAGAGSLIAYGMLSWGLAQAFLLDRLMNGLWFGFLGWFLLSAAKQSVAQLEFRRILARLRVSDVLRTDCAGPASAASWFPTRRVRSWACSPCMK
jgi:Zn-dependent protease